jgi:hypothetical protein
MCDRQRATAVIKLLCSTNFLSLPRVRHWRVEVGLLAYVRIDQFELKGFAWIRAMSGNKGS